jgi:hypothetical protein
MRHDKLAEVNEIAVLLVFDYESVLAKRTDPIRIRPQHANAVSDRAVCLHTLNNAPSVDPTTHFATIANINKLVAADNGERDVLLRSMGKC